MLADEQRVLLVTRIARAEASCVVDGWYSKGGWGGWVGRGGGGQPHLSPTS